MKLLPTFVINVMQVCRVETKTKTEEAERAAMVTGSWNARREE